jgi:hypothetical protein
MNGALTLPTVATVNVSRASSGKLPSSSVLITGFTSVNMSNLSGWVINDVPGTITKAKVVGNQVQLIVPSGWVLTVQ